MPPYCDSGRSATVAAQIDAETEIGRNLFRNPVFSSKRGFQASPNLVLAAVGSSANRYAEGMIAQAKLSILSDFPAILHLRRGNP
jgi:hypothetical protein